jgi:hypothetical protein
MNICIDLDNTVNYLCAKEESVELNYPSLGVTFLLLSDRLWLLVVESQERRSSQPQKGDNLRTSILKRPFHTIDLPNQHGARRKSGVVACIAIKLSLAPSSWRRMKSN